MTKTAIVARPLTPSRWGAFEAWFGTRGEYRDCGRMHWPAPRKDYFTDALAQEGIAPAHATAGLTAVARPTPARPVIGITL